MNSNPWNVGSIDEFSYFNCPECTFHTKEDKNFQDHATRNHPLSSVLFSKGTKVITFSGRNDLNHLKQIASDQKCNELLSKYKLPDKLQVSMSKVDKSKRITNVPPNNLKGQQLQKASEEKMEKHTKTTNKEIYETNLDTSDSLETTLSSRNFAELQATENEIDPLAANDDSEDSKLVPKSKKKLIQCYSCQTKFSIEKELVSHFAEKHPEKKPYKCNICDTTFSLKHILKRHLSTQHENKVAIMCQYCEKTFSRKENLRSHHLLAHFGEPFSIVHEDVKTVSSELYGCDICKTFFSIKSNLMNHIESAHGKKELNEKPSYLEGPFSSVHEDVKTVSSNILDDNTEMHNDSKDIMFDDENENGSEIINAKFF